MLINQKITKNRNGETLKLHLINSYYIIIVIDNYRIINYNGEVVETRNINQIKNSLLVVHQLVTPSFLVLLRANQAPRKDRHLL